MVPGSLYRALVYTIHGFHFRYKKSGIRHLAKLAEWYTIHQAACTIFVSGSDARTARNYKIITEKDVFKIIRNGSRREDIPAGSAAGLHFDIIFLGRLVAVKNVLLLPEILLALRPMRPSLCVIGGGECDGALRRRTIEAGLSDQVSFLGPLPHAEAMAYLRRSRVMILPSRWEGMPVSAIEAMHCGVPVVASKVEGTAEVVADGDTGYLVETDDVAGYAGCLHRILSDATLRSMLSRHAIARARAEFSVERQLLAHVDLYTEIAAAPTSGVRRRYHAL
jgi:glycosyltransferase involved in cell wall biosynthesis